MTHFDRLTPAELVRVVEWRLPQIDHAAFHVYVAWSADVPERALYVGRSDGVIRRVGIHLKTTSWAAQAARFDLYEFPTAAAMEAGEIYLIDHLQPLHNGMFPLVIDGVFHAWKPRA